MLTLDAVRKRYGQLTAVDGLSLKAEHAFERSTEEAAAAGNRDVHAPL